MNGNWKVFCSSRAGKTSKYTQFFKFKFKFYSDLFVRQNVRFSFMSARLSIKLPAKGQSGVHSGSKSQFS